MSPSIHSLPDEVLEAVMVMARLDLKERCATLGISLDPL